MRLLFTNDQVSFKFLNENDIVYHIKGDVINLG